MSLRLLAFIALSAFLLCALSAHQAHAHDETTAMSGGVGQVTTEDSIHTGSAWSMTLTPDRLGGSDAAAPHEAAGQHGQAEHSGGGHDVPPMPTCHALGTHFTDLTSRIVPIDPHDFLALAGALTLVVSTLTLGTRRSWPWSSTRPPCPRTGFALLLSLGVSRT